MQIIVSIIALYSSQKVKCDVLIKCRTQVESLTVLVGDLKRPNLIDSDVASQMQLTRPVNTLRYDMRHCLCSCKLCFQLTTLR